MLGIERSRIIGASWLVNGLSWIGVRLPSAQEVLALDPDPAGFGTYEIGVIGAHAPGISGAENENPGNDGPQLEVRAFIGGDPVFEDPVTGNLNAGLAQWLMDTDGVGDYTAAQETIIGRQGRIHIEVKDHTIWVGGHTTTCVRGTIRI